jgi:hypothetical protein
MNRLSRLLTASGALCLAGATVVPLAASGTAAAAPSHGGRAHATHVPTHSARASRGKLQFSHEVVVDEQRSGFEPDILIDGKDRMYTSVPNGSSEGTSFVWISRTHGKTWQLVPGNVVHGKPTTCPQGGGDTELQLDKKNDLFLSDLQNLTNLSNSVTKDQGKTWSTTCVGADNTPVDRMWYSVQGSLGDPNFAIYEEYDAVESGADPNSPGGNQLVEEVSSDGVNFVPVVNPDFASSDCLGGGFYNCVTDDEGISGNQLVMPNGEVVIGHSSADGNQVEVSYAKPQLTRTGGSITAAQAHWHTVTINKSLCPDKANQAPGICGATQFVTVSQDTAGNLYASFSSRKLGKYDSNTGTNPQLGPYNVYVAVSKNGGKTWSRPYRVSRGGSNSFSWVTAGSKGRVAMAWYHSNVAKGTPNYQGDGDKYGYEFDSLAHAEFSVQVGESINALSKHPKFRVATVSEHPVKYGPICTQGLGCTVSGGDRSLGDFMEVSKDKRGALALSYVDDTSNTYTSGATAFQENGPPVIVRQVHGVSLIKGKGNRSGFINGPGRGPGRQMNRIGDGHHDDWYSANGRYTSAGKALDLRGAGLSESKDRKTLIVHLRAESLKSLAVPPTAGGTTGEWILRFTTYNPHTKGNGHIYYAGMESSGGGTPTFYDGDTFAPNQQANVQLSMGFSSAHQVKGSYSAKHGTITIKAPFTDFPGIKKHSMLYSVTAFTGTTAGPLSVPNQTGVQGQINQVDATSPFDFKVNRAAPRTKKQGSGAAAPAATSGGFGPLAQGLTGGLGGLGLLLLGTGAALGVRRRRPALPS